MNEKKFVQFCAMNMGIYAQKHKMDCVAYIERKRQKYNENDKRNGKI